MSMNPQLPEIVRIRVRYGKEASLRFIGHLDLQRLWGRLLRRSALPVRYTKGFHPRARLNLASALPLGFVSDEELLDFWMDAPRPLAEVQAKLKKASPPGLEIYSVQQIDNREDALQMQVKASEFEVSFYDPQNTLELSLKIGALMDKPGIIKIRRKKTYDLRPLILDLQVVTPLIGNLGIWMRLKAEPRATGRPDDVLEELGYPNTAYLVRRTKLILN